MALEKTKIISELSATALLVPERVAAGLAANARIKFALTWLQAAEAPSHDVDQVFAGLEQDRSMAGLAEEALYEPPTPVRQGEGVLVPHAQAVVARMLDDLGEMRRAIEVGAAAGLADPAQAQKFASRAAAVSERAHLDNDLLPPGFVSTLSKPAGANEDSLHSLVMDLHRALNCIVNGLGEETVDGARVHLLKERDRPRVAAFMRGLNRTAPLRLGHPGLSTNAIRDKARLIIQNDIGTTDAHVLVVYVEGLELSISYSDIHRARLEFFMRRLKELSWSIANRHAADFEEDYFYLATGRLKTKDVAELESVLERLGASLVFLIDWNKARKSLRRLVSKSAALAILDWAADQEVGHRGYLELGADAMVDELLATVSKATGGFYPTLQSATGTEGAEAYLRDALRVASEGLRAGRSAVAVKDLLRSELLVRLASIGERIIDAALDHAALMLDLGNLVHSALLDPGRAQETMVARAKHWEQLADQQVVRIRDLAGNGRERVWSIIASQADDAADGLEETAFRLQFLPPLVPSLVHDGLLRLSQHATLAVKNYIRLLFALRGMRDDSTHQDMRDFLDLLEKLHEEEHATDAAEREVFSALMRSEVDAKAITIVASIAASLEETGDALLRTGRLICDQTLGELFAR